MQTERTPDLNRQEIEKFVVRLPKGMRSKIAHVSRLSRRSMNSEIIARLEQSFAVLESDDSNSPAAPLLRAVEAPTQANQETILLAHFRTMGADKQAALLELLTS